MATDAGMPALDGGETVWCEGCRKLKKEVTRLQEEHAINYQTLKQKIISTDLLIRKYRTKCEEYDLQNKHMEEQSRRLERTQLDCEMLETQLKASLQSTEPLRKTQHDLEAKLKVKDTEIQNLKNSLEGAEMIQKQYEALIADNNLYANEEERKQLDRKLQNLESSNQRYANNLKSTKEELRTVKSEISRSSKNYRLLETRHKRILTRLEKYFNLLKENDLLPPGDRLPARANFNSGGEDQDEADYYSDDTMEDENKNWSAPSPAHDLDLDLDQDLKDVASEKVCDHDLKVVVAEKVSNTKKQQDLRKKIIDMRKQPEPKTKPKKKGKNNKKSKVVSSENTEDTEGTTADEHKRESDIDDIAKTANNVDVRRLPQNEHDDSGNSYPESCSDFGDDFVGAGLSAMKYFFTFSPISAPVSPLPPSPAPGRRMRSTANRPPDLEDTDDSMDKMAANLQSRLHDNTSRSVRRSPRLKEKTDSSIFSSEDEQESSSKRTPNMRGHKKPNIRPSPKLQNKLIFTGEGDREPDMNEDEIGVIPKKDQKLKEVKKDGKVRGMFDRKGSLPFVVQHLFKDVGRIDNNVEFENDMEMENGADIDMDSQTSVDTVTANDDISNHSPKKTKSFSPKPCDTKAEDVTSEASSVRMTRSVSKPETAFTEPKIQSPRPKSAMAGQTFLTPQPPRSRKLRALSPRMGEEEGKETRRKRTVSLPTDLSDLEPMRRSPRLRSSENKDTSPLKEKRSHSEENLKEKIDKPQETISEKSPVRMLRSRSIEPPTEPPTVSNNDKDKTALSPKSPISRKGKNVSSAQGKIQVVKCVPNDQDAVPVKTIKASPPKTAVGCESDIPETKPEQPLRRTRSRTTLSSAESSESDIFVEKEKSPKARTQSPRLRNRKDSESKSDILTSSVLVCNAKGLSDEAQLQTQPKSSALESSDSESNSTSPITLRNKKTPMKRKQMPPKLSSSSDSESDDASEPIRNFSKMKSQRKDSILSSSESDDKITEPTEASSCHPSLSESEEGKIPRTRTRSGTSLAQSSDSEKQETVRKPVRRSETSARKVIRKKKIESEKPEGPKEFKSKEFISTESDSDDEDEQNVNKTLRNSIEQNPNPEFSVKIGDGPPELPTFERSRVSRGRGKKSGRGRQVGPPGKLHPLKASTYPSLKDSFRKVETIQDGKVSRVPDDHHLSKDSDETAPQNLPETKTKSSNSTDQDDSRTLKPTKETESESDKSSGSGFFPLYNKRARQLRHRYKPIVSDKNFADIILERRRMTRSVSDGSSSEAKKSESEDKDKVTETNVNISKRTERFVERLKHSAERVKSENSYGKGNKKVFSTLPKQTIIAPTRRGLNRHVSSKSDIETIGSEVQQDVTQGVSSKGISGGSEKTASSLPLGKDVKSDVTDNKNVCILQEGDPKMSQSIASPSNKEETDQTKSVVTIDSVNEKTAGNPPSCSALDKPCPMSEEQNISSPAEPENSNVNITESSNIVEVKSADNIPVNSIKNGTCSEGEGVAEMETSGAEKKDEQTDTHKDFISEEQKDIVSGNKPRNKEFRHVSSASEMEGIHSESDAQYTESDIQTSDMDTIQVFVYQDASQTSASESVAESPVKSLSPKPCVQSPEVDKKDLRTSVAVRESPKSHGLKSPHENTVKGKDPECQTEFLTGGHSSAFRSVAASPRSVKSISPKTNVQSNDSQTQQVSKDPTEGKLTLDVTSESVKECKETVKPTTRSLTPPASAVDICDKDDSQSEEQTHKGSAINSQVVETGVDSDISKKDKSNTNHASPALPEKSTTPHSSKNNRSKELENDRNEDVISPRRRSSRHLSRNSAISDDYPVVETISTPVIKHSRTLEKSKTENLECKDTNDKKKETSEQAKNKSMSVDVAKSNYVQKGSIMENVEKMENEIKTEPYTAESPKSNEKLVKGKTSRRMKNSGNRETANHTPRNEELHRKKTSDGKDFGTSADELSEDAESYGKDDADNKNDKSKTNTGPSIDAQSEINENINDPTEKEVSSQSCPKVMCDSKGKNEISEDDVSEDVETTQEVEEDDQDSADTSVNSAPETRQKPKKRVTIKRQKSFDQEESKAGECTTSEKKSKTDLKNKRKNLKKSGRNKVEDRNNVQESVDEGTSLKQTELVTVEDSCREGTLELTGVEDQELDFDLDEDSDDSAKKKKVETQCSFGFSVNASTSEPPQEGFSLLDSLNLIPELEEGEEEEQESKSILSDLGSLDPERAVSPEIVSITQKSCFTSISALIRDELRSTASTSSPLPPSPMNFFNIIAPVSPLPLSPAPSSSNVKKGKKSKGKKKSKKLLEALSTSEINPIEAKPQTITKGKHQKSGKLLDTANSETTNMTSLESSITNLESCLITSIDAKMSKQDSEQKPSSEIPFSPHLDEAISLMSGSQRRIARVAKKQSDLPNFGATPVTTTLKPKPVYSRTTSGEGPSASTGTTSMSLAKQQLTKRQQNQEEKQMRNRKRKSSESEMLPVKKQVFTPPKAAGSTCSEVAEMLTQYLQNQQEDTTDSLIDKWFSKGDKTLVAIEIFRESVKVLQACREDQRPLVERRSGEEEEEVMMTDTEIRLLDILTCLLHKHEECPRHQLMELLWNAIFLSCTPCLGRLSLCRMFTALCRHEGDVEQVRVFVYKLVSCGYLSYVQPVLAVVGVWPLALTPGPDPSAMSLVVRHIVLTACQSQSAPPEVKQLGPCFQELCGWSPLTETPSQLLCRIIEKLKLAVTADLAGTQFETMKSIELLLWSHGWRFIYMSFVNQHLTSVTDAWKARGDNSNINPKLAITLLRIFGNIYQLPRFTQKHKEFSKALKRCLIPILDVPTKHTELPMCCAEVLAELSPLHPHFIMDILSQWFKKHRSEVPASLRNKLEQTRHFIATKISPFHVDSFV